MNNKTVAFISHGCFDFGGMEKHLLVISEALDSEKSELFFIGEYSKLFKRQFIEVKKTFLHFDQKNYFSLFSLMRLIKILNTNQIELLHCLDFKSSIVGRVASLFCKTKVFNTYHTDPLFWLSKPKTRRETITHPVLIVLDVILNWLFSTRIIFVSEKLYLYYTNKKLSPLSRSLFIRNTISPENEFVVGNRYKDKLRRNLGIDTNDKVICTVGRLSHEKGLDILLKATLQVSYDSTRIVLLIVGDGPEKESLQRESVGSAWTVLYLGHQEDPNIYLTISDIYTLPSRIDQYSISLLEALNAGLPCVVSDVGSNDEMVRNNFNGFLFENENTEELASKLSILLNNQSICLDMGANSRITFARINDVELMIKQYLSIYQSA